ncbi:secreted alpha glucosidase like family 31 glycosyltransferase [Cryptosporidium canis]|nr:secreted alpha glucosidase like family 31 glycosyltransferase [Cryptosporidium canis]
MRLGFILLVFFISIFLLISQKRAYGRKFKRCSDNSFCKRYRKFVEFVSSHKDEGSIWSVRPNSLEFFKSCETGRGGQRLSLVGSECTTVYFELQNIHHPTIPSLRCNIFIYKIGVFRLQIDDSDTGLSKFKRYKVGKDVVFKDKLVSQYLLKKEDKSNLSIKVSSDRVTIAFIQDIVYHRFKEADKCRYVFEMYLNPFRIQTSLCERAVMTINGNQFLNFERSGREYSMHSKESAQIRQKRHITSIKDLAKKEEHQDEKSGWSIFQLIREAVSQIFFKKQLHISEIVDAVDIYPNNIWTEQFQNFIDFKYNGPTSIGVDLQIHSCNDVYGLAEKTASLNLDDFYEPYRFYNVDNFKYKLNSTDPMYGSSPMLISLSDFPSDHRVLFSSVLWLNPSDTYVKITKYKNDYSEKYTDTWWVSETGILDIVTLVSSNLEELYYNLGIITGFPNFAPRYTLGFHYSKWEHTSEERVEEIQSLLEKNKIPYDSIWLDIEHTENKQYFTWNKTSFPNMSRLIKKLDQDNKYLVIISDPHIRANNAYYIYNFFEKLKFCLGEYSRIALNYKRMVKFLFTIRVIPRIHLRINCNVDLIISKDNINNSRFISKPFNSPWVKVPNYFDNKSKINDFVGECWPGPSKYFDFFSNKVGYFYSRYFEKMFKNHTNLGYWVDMNEPSIFNLPENSFPKQVRFGDEDLDDRQVHSLYSFIHVRYVYNGLIRRFNGRMRPFILSRSFWIGSHRYSVIWTGDTESNWNYYYYTIITNVRNAICGFSLTGSDVGGYEGFIHRGLFIRWHQLGIWFPFYRQHSSIDTLNRDSIFSSSILRSYIELRYSLIPYWYTLLAINVFYGIPMIKPLFWLNPKDMNLRSINTSFLVGNSFMINSLEMKSFTSITLHDYICDFKYNNERLNISHDLYKIWYNAYHNIMYIDTRRQYFDNNYMNNTPDFIKGGSIIPYSVGEDVLSSREQLRNPLKLIIYLTGKLMDSNRLKNGLLFPNMRNYNYTSGIIANYNDYMVDIFTLHSEGSIYLDDGESFSYLSNDYIMNDIIFTLGNNNESIGFTPNIMDNLIEKNILRSTFDEKYQREKLRLFKENFNYLIYIQKINREWLDMNNHHRMSLDDEIIENYQDLRDDKYNKSISLIIINGMLIKPREIYLYENNEKIKFKINFRLNTAKYYGYNNLIQGELYSIEINLEENKMIDFDNYDWIIKINF